MKWLSIRAYIGRRHRVNFRILAIILVSLMALSASAQADTIVRGFKSLIQLQPGWVVTLRANDPKTVEVSPANDPSRIYGVVIDPSQAPVTLQSQGGDKVFVATNGTYPVLVNTQHGQINPGDYISMSGVDGIGAKATPAQPYMLGQSLEKFDGKNGAISGSGELAVGRIKVTVTPARNPLSNNDVAVPGPLKKVTQSLGGQNLSALRIYAALVIFLATAFVATLVLIVGVRSGMVAIGRNPLSRHYIIEGLLRVIGVAILVFIIGVFAVYLLLKL